MPRGRRLTFDDAIFHPVSFDRKIGTRPFFQIVYCEKGVRPSFLSNPVNASNYA